MISARRMLRVGAPLGRRAFSDTAMHGTTILCVRRGGKVVMIGDGQVSMGNVVVKGNARKVRRIGDDILVGFAGSTADAFTLLERLEKKLEEHPGQLTRACVDLAKAWRTDKYLRRLEALILVADRSVTYELTGTGDVLEPTDGVMGIGSGGQRGAGAARGVDRGGGLRTPRSATARRYALAAARALSTVDGLEAADVAKRAMDVAADMCVFTNSNFIVEELDEAPPGDDAGEGA